MSKSITYTTVGALVGLLTGIVGSIVITAYTDVEYNETVNEDARLNSHTFGRILMPKIILSNVITGISAGLVTGLISTSE